MKSGRAGSCINSSSLTLARFGRAHKYILSIYRQIAGYCSWIQSNWFKFCYFDWKAMIYKVLKPYYDKINPLLDLLLPFVMLARIDVWSRLMTLALHSHSQDVTGWEHAICSRIRIFGNKVASHSLMAATGEAGLSSADILSLHLISSCGRSSGEGRSGLYVAIASLRFTSSSARMNSGHNTK